MKKIVLLFTALILSGSLAWSQSQELFRIDYQIINATDTEHNNILMTSWVNKDYFRIDNEAFSGLIYIKHRAENVSFALSPSSEEYLIYPQEEDPISLADYPIKLIPGKKKIIAGYPCKLAQLNVDYGIEGEEETVMDIWYTEDIPNFNWGEFDFFQLIKGAVLSLQVNELHLEAKKISIETLENSAFEVPDGYTEISSDEYADDTNYQLSEDRFMYADESITYYGLADANENKITEPIYTHIYPFSGDGIALANDKNYKSGAIDKDGKVLIPFKYDYLLYDESTQQFLFSENEKYGMLDKYGKVFIPAKYEMLSFFNHGLATFTLGDKTGVIDKNQKIIIPAVHDMFLGFNKTNFAIMEGEEYVLYNINQNKRVAGGFGYLSLQDETNLILAEKGGKFGYIDEQGKTIIPFKYGYATLFSDGLASVQDNADDDETYLINTKGERVESLQE